MFVCILTMALTACGEVISITVAILYFIFAIVSFFLSFFLSLFIYLRVRTTFSPYLIRNTHFKTQVSTYENVKQGQLPDNILFTRIHPYGPDHAREWSEIIVLLFSLHDIYMDAKFTV